MLEQVNLLLEIADRHAETTDVVSIKLRAPNEEVLPAWTPGAHLDLVLPSGAIRQYSLCGDPRDLKHYRIAVLNDPKGRGGSREIHERLRRGDQIAVSRPRNNFELIPAARYLFIAGGIGITPLLPMIEECIRKGSPWKLVYGARTRSSMLFLDRVLRDARGNVELVAEDVRGRPDIDRLLAVTPPEALIYCCGPAGLLQAVQEAAARCDRLNHLRIERFSLDRGRQGQEPMAFEVVLARSGMTLQVPSDRKLGEVLRAAGAPIYFSCESGCCGTCRTHVLEGVPEHNDVLMNDEERADSGDMMVCVGRAKCAKLVLDL